MEVAQHQPDIILLELATGCGFPDLVRQYREVCDARIIVDYDDFLPNLPVKNHHRSDIAKTVVKDMRRIMTCADGIVVSTPALADAYAPYHDNIRVAMNRLSVEMWGNLLSERRTSKKLRVGWAGGNSHAGDLDILRAVVKALEQDIEWVFMGMKPDGVACEYHRGVPFHFYPEKLASLNLDLALVPLEINHFNECKSHLRLLEIGACGVPIIATDIEPYRCGLPVTRVRNRFRDWMAAIREHISEPAELAQRGDALRAAVHQHWMLRDDGLNDWQHAWLNH